MVYDHDITYHIDCVMLLYMFLYLACFVVSTYVIFIRICCIPMDYANSTAFIYKITEDI